MFIHIPARSEEISGKTREHKLLYVKSLHNWPCTMFLTLHYEWNYTLKYKINANPLNKWPPPVADPGFPRGGRNHPTPKDGGANLLFGQIFPQNCMQIKDIAPGCASLPHPLDRPMASERRSVEKSSKICCVVDRKFEVNHRISDSSNLKRHEKCFVCCYLSTRSSSILIERNRTDC